MRRHQARTSFAVGWSCAVFALLPTVAEAHAGGADAGLINGLMHPVFGLDHLLAMISVGVVSVQLGGKNVWRIPAAFVAAMAVGAVLGILDVRLPHTALGIAGSVLVLGLGIVFSDRRLSPWPIIALVSFFGACHGHAHGIEIPTAVSPALYTLGFLMSTSTLHIFGMLIGELASMNAWLLKGLRVTGGVVAASGVIFLVWALEGMS